MKQIHVLSLTEASKIHQPYLSLKHLSTSFTLVWVGWVKITQRNGALWWLSVGHRCAQRSPFLPVKISQHKLLPDSAHGLSHSSQSFVVLWDKAKWPRLIWLPLDSLLWHVFPTKQNPTCASYLNYWTGPIDLCFSSVFEDGGSVLRLPHFPLY